MIRKLRVKLVAASMLSLFVVLTIIVGSAALFNYREIVSSADRVLSLLEENNGTFPEAAFFHETPPQGAPVFSPELPYESRYFSVSLTEDGEVITASLGRIAAVNEETASSYARKAITRSQSRGFLEGYRYIVSLEEEEYRVIFLDCNRDLRAFRSFVFTSAAVSLAGLLAVMLLVIFLSGRIVRPFSENYEKQKRFITDAGHELKTPLTIIDADAEVLEMDYGSNEWLRDIQSQTRRLAELTNNLIFLTRMEEEQPQTEAIDFPLSDVAEETVETFQSLARTQGKTLACTVPPMISMCGDEQAIRRLITILLDNAVKYSEEGGRISLTLEKQKNALRLSVYNTANYVSRESLPHLFDRFYRTDQSRNSRTGGYGLGLSIAAAITNAHKGKIAASTQDERSLLITVTFPA